MRTIVLITGDVNSQKDKGDKNEKVYSRDKINKIAIDFYKKVYRPNNENIKLRKQNNKKCKSVEGEEIL